MFNRLVRNFAAVQMKFTPEGRYAYTLFTVAQESKTLDKVNDDMQFVLELFRHSEDLRSILQNPVIKSADVMPMLKSVLPDGQPETFRLIELCLQNKRIAQFEQIAMDFNEYYEAKDAKETVNVVSADELSKAQKDQVEASLKEFDNDKNFIVSYSIDASILGGLQLYFPTAFMDLSLKTRLDKLEDEVSTMAA